MPYRHEVDHLVSRAGRIELHAQPVAEPYAGRWNARVKDVLEKRLHRMVCAGDLSLRHAQRQEAANWVAAYRRYVGEPPLPAQPISKPKPKPADASAPAGSCEPGYSPCLPVTDDLDCGDLCPSQTPVTVTGDDPYGLDADGDGTGCNS